MFTDTHAHLYLEEFSEDIDDVIKRAVSNGVNKFFLPNIDSLSIDPMMGLAEKYPQNCFPMMGLHPCSVKDDYKDELLIAKDCLERLKFYAIGEIGIDLHWDKTFTENQEKAFREQLGWAKEYKLPVVIHQRNAFKETFEIVQEMNDKSLRGIFHCFAGTMEEAEKIISLGGFKLGIGGVVTFKNSGLDKVVEQLSLEHMVLETDSPYLAPAPYRGKRNESSYIPIIAQKIAELKGVTIDKVARVTSENSREIFGI